MHVMRATAAIQVRPARDGDRPFILGLAPRLAEFDLPPWRSAGEIAQGEAQTLAAALSTLPADADLLVAESPEGERLGFIFLETDIDYFRGTPHAHVGILAVDQAAEGRGVAGALMQAGEEWARARGYQMITLNVFEANSRARAVYQRLGYLPETLRYVKPL
ncbi:MAG: GNAT family N-acetyltransferase [Gemmatimonadales bacterium]